MWSKGTAVLLLALLMAAAGPAAPGPEPLDVRAYRIAVRLDPAVSELRAETVITLQIGEAGRERVSLDLVGLTVDSVRVDGASAAFSRTGGLLTVELGRSAAAGDTAVIDVHYHGVPEDGLIFGRSPYGKPTVFADNWPARARYWFPAVDRPGDKAVVEFRVTAPAEWRVVANGRLVSEEPLADGLKLTVWSTDRPIPVYTMVIGAADMAVDVLGAMGCDGENGRCVPVTQWTFPEDEERARQVFYRAPEVLAFFDSLIGPFAYEKLALVQSSTRYGGMENASAIFFNKRLARAGSGDRLVAHEIAHQWFGDAVTEREWPDVWLSEGFATYFASVFFEFNDGEAAAGEIRAGDERRYLASARDVARPVIDAEPENLFQLLNSNSYQKGAWVLHMLRGLVGDSAFFKGVRDYYAEHRNDTALTADFRRALERASGQELGWFFDQWLRRPGYPDVRVRYSWDGEEKRLDLDVRQAQPWPPFRFPLEIRVELEGYAFRRTFRVERREEHFEWSLDSEPRSVSVDPNNLLLGPTSIVQ